MQRLLVLTIALAGCQEYQVTPTVDPTVGVPDDDTDGFEDSESESDIPDGVATGGVEGMICDALESGLAGVQVMVEHEWGLATTFTDADGHYELLDLPAGDHVLIAQADGYFDQIAIYIPPNEVIEIASDECGADCEIPVPCVGLAEAVDRGGALMQLHPGGIDVRNVSEDLDICLEEWVVLLSDTSQDAILGEDVTVRLGPGESETFPYAADIYGTSAELAWWCIERWQYTAEGSYYDYNGSLAPEPVFDFVRRRTDTDNDGAEDHSDFEELALRTQHNIWDVEAQHPIVIVGRARSLFTFTGSGLRPEVVVEVKNLGQQPGAATVVEVVPPGLIVSDVDPAGLVTVLPDGSTQVQWEVALDAARPDFSYASATHYDQVDLTYHIELGTEPCEGRCEGNPAAAQFADSDGTKWLSVSEPLIIEHCAD